MYWLHCIAMHCIEFSLECVGMDENPLYLGETGEIRDTRYELH